ncbi:MAG: pyridoxamine 5'-phosphate oxidase family protein [Bryobacteraceae bacterium]
MSVTRMDLLAFLRRERYAVLASASTEGHPQAALVGIAVNERFELIFDTLQTTRKASNVRQNPRVAFVIGPTDPRAVCTVQYEGVADEPRGLELDELLAHYYQSFPDGPARRNWPGLMYVRVKPLWIRYSNYALDPPEIVEFRGEDLG